MFFCLVFKLNLDSFIKSIILIYVCNFPKIYFSGNLFIWNEIFINMCSKGQHLLHVTTRVNERFIIRRFQRERYLLLKSIHGRCKFEIDEISYMFFCNHVFLYSNTWWVLTRHIYNLYIIHDVTINKVSLVV